MATAPELGPSKTEAHFVTEDVERQRGEESLGTDRERKNQEEGERQRSQENDDLGLVGATPFPSINENDQDIASSQLLENGPDTGVTQHSAVMLERVRSKQCRFRDLSLASELLRGFMLGLGLSALHCWGWG